MADQQTHSRLHRHMINTVALEAEIEQVLAQTLGEMSEHPQVETIFKEFYEMVKSQRKTLEARLRSVVSNMPDFGKITTTTPFSEVSQESDYPASEALQNLYAMFSRAIMTYTTLQPLTLRFRDSWVASEENTAIIVRQHTNNYAAALQKISQLIHDVVIWEMDQEGLECTCTCPSCSLGVCLCALSSRVLLGHAWSEAGPIVANKGITVLPPRSASAALNAALYGGDIIIAADGHEINTVNEMQDAIQAHKSGENIELHIQRESGELVEIAVEIP
ncbi:PDZ domain-containing protein [Chloroflexota bacterium]